MECCVLAKRKKTLSVQHQQRKRGLTGKPKWGNGRPPARKVRRGRR